MSKTDGMPARLPAYAHAAVLASLNEAHPTRCRRLHGVPANDPDACDVGLSGTDAPTFAVWGDSHALQYLDALREATDRSGIAGQLFHFPGCEPAAEPGGFGGAACDTHNAHVLGYIDSTPSIRTVLVVLRQNDPGRVDRAWRAVDALVARGRRVVVLGPTPEAHRAVAQEWLALELLHRRPVPEMSIGRGESLVDARTSRPVDSYDTRLARWQAQARAALARHGDRIEAIDLTPLFCDASRCWLVRGGVGMLRDTDHLTTAAARRVLALALPTLTGMQP
ncbi:SGNH hydrolase domain-containing protein [Ramlibacter sp. MMS24-I3-19]|uniref:SGNH hydrolase domain-containing protein n=1 Tax=Ramlibacter sp. MMS24-I3-19 TaxID=3416606 RepID=UPI003CFEB9D0